MKSHDLTGRVFGELTVVGFSHKKGEKKLWRCVCSCGAERVVYACHLLAGNSRSCMAGGQHGVGKKTPGYSTHKSMIARCHNPNHVHYARYGGRGIFVCDVWRNSFPAFYKDMGPRPSGMSIDRIDGTKGYSPENCRWATPVEQQNNMKTNRVVEIDGHSMTISQHSRRMGVKYPTLYARLKRGGVI